MPTTRQRLDTVLADDAVLCLPTTPAPAPRRGERMSARRDLRARISMLTCIAGTSGRPPITLPLAAVGGWPGSGRAAPMQGCAPALTILPQD